MKSVFNDMLLFLNVFFFGKFEAGLGCSVLCLVSVVFCKVLCLVKCHAL